MAEHILSAEPTHSRWNRALPPRLAIAPGDTVHMECVDASSAQVRPGMSVADYLTIDRGRIHALTETIFVEGAEPGDVLQIEVLKVVDKGWGWTSVIPGLGFLKERFSELGKVRERPGRLLTYPGRSIFMSDWTRSTSDLATCWRGTGPRSRSFILRE
jgi:acetamidase/formamidase